MVERDLLVRAADLFNRKLYFECHDVLEEEWAGARGPERAFLNGLIHAAVGMYHVAAGNYVGAESQLEKAVTTLEPFRLMADGPRAVRTGAATIDLTRLLGRLERCLAKAGASRLGDDVTWDAADVPEMILI